MTRQLRNYDWMPLGIFCAGLFLFTVGLDHQEIIGFESRFYLFALEMWRHGFRGFPTTYGMPYPDYPVTTTLFIYGGGKLFGHLDKWIAVLPSAIAAAITLAATYAIGALQSRQWGYLAVCFLLLTNMFVREARTISPDQFVLMATTLCFYVLHSAAHLQKPRRLLWIPALFLFGFACRGPLGLVVPAGVVCVFYGLDRNYQSFFLFGLMALLLLILGCAVLFCAAYEVGGMPFLHEVWHMEVSGRLQDAHVPWYFYFTESLGAYAITFPLVLLVAVGLLWKPPAWQRQDVNLTLKLLGWMVVVMVGLTIPAGKKIRYILAIVPALSLVSATLFALPAMQKWQVVLRKCVYGFCFCLPLFCLILVATVLRYALQHADDMLEIVSIIQPTVRFAVLAFVALQGVMFLGRRSPSLVLSMAALAFVSFYILLLEPINLALNQGRAFVTTVEALRYQAQAKLVFYQENPDGTPIKYVMNMPREEQPIFISTPESLAKIDFPAFFIADPQHFAELPRTILRSIHVIDTGSVGHNRLVVFEKND